MKKIILIGFLASALILIFALIAYFWVYAAPNESCDVSCEGKGGICAESCESLRIDSQFYASSIPPSCCKQRSHVCCLPSSGV